LLLIKLLLLLLLAAAADGQIYPIGEVDVGAKVHHQLRASTDTEGTSRKMRTGLPHNREDFLGFELN
jgi:hypothetical protein